MKYLIPFPDYSVVMTYPVNLEAEELDSTFAHNCALTLNHKDIKGEQQDSTGNSKKTKMNYQRQKLL